jgi:hypothetical protein
MARARHCRNAVLIGGSILVLYVLLFLGHFPAHSLPQSLRYPASRPGAAPVVPRQRHVLIPAGALLPTTRLQPAVPITHCADVIDFVMLTTKGHQHTFVELHRMLSYTLQRLTGKVIPTVEFPAGLQGHSLSFCARPNCIYLFLSFCLVPPADISHLPQNVIIVNFEPLLRKATVNRLLSTQAINRCQLNHQQLGLNHKYVIWDYSRLNIDSFWRQHMHLSPLLTHYLPLFSFPGLIPDAAIVAYTAVFPEPGTVDMDVVLLGTEGPRRHAILMALRRAGVKVLYKVPLHRYPVPPYV